MSVNHTGLNVDADLRVWGIFPPKPWKLARPGVVDRSEFEMLCVNGPHTPFPGCLHHQTCHTDATAALNTLAWLATAAVCRCSAAAQELGAHQTVACSRGSFPRSKSSPSPHQASSSSTACCCAANMAARKKQEECIYNWGELPAAAAADAGPQAPRMKTYRVSAPAAAAPRRMHEDSSQVRPV